MAQAPIIISRMVLNSLTEGICDEPENAPTILSNNIDKLNDKNLSNATISRLKNDDADYETIPWYFENEEKITFEQIIE